MNLKEISLSIYSFGYSAGFIRDTRPEAAAPVVSIENVADLVRKHGLGGIEFPVDRYFKVSEIENAEAFIGGLLRAGMRVAVDLENFEVPYIRALLPILVRNGLRFARIKMSGCYGGNRYREPGFPRWVETFVVGLRSLLPDLRKQGVRLLMENHQDLGTDDLVEIIGATSADCVGINWDIGNSLAVLDTPATFLQKAGGFIGNVHLKDYKIYRCTQGFYLSRCALGEGVVDFGSFIPGLRRKQGPVPMAIELGAQNTRRVDVFEKAYWHAYRPYTVTEKIEFFSFFNTHLQDGEQWRSPWERSLPGRSIIESEMQDLNRSVAFLRGLVV